MTNTEKPTTKQEAKKRGMVKTPKQNKEQLKNIPKIEDKKIEEEKTENKTEEKKEEKKGVAKKAPKKTEVKVNCPGLPISTKEAIEICKFIKNKKINQAILDLEQVISLRKAIPMKGEIPHRKGKIMSGRYPIRASKYFIKTLKGLKGNANNHELEEPIIVKAIANFAERPYGKRGRIRKKRTNLIIIAQEKKILNNKGGKLNGRKENS